MFMIFLIRPVTLGDYCGTIWGPSETTSLQFGDPLMQGCAWEYTLGSHFGCLIVFEEFWGTHRKDIVLPFCGVLSFICANVDVDDRRDFCRFSGWKRWSSL